MTELSDEHDAELVKKLISEHVQETGSARGKEILAKFDEYACHFKKIVPNDYHRMLVEISRAEERGLDHEEAVLEAFYETTGQKRLA